MARQGFGGAPSVCQAQWRFFLKLSMEPVPNIIFPAISGPARGEAVALVASAFAACKKGGGYMTEPVVVATP